MNAVSGRYGYLAEFATPERLLEAVQAARSSGYAHLDAYSPVPIEGLAAAVGFTSNRLAIWVLLGALLGGLGFYGLEYYSAAISYPLDIGGRPLNSWPAFIFPAVEMTLLCGAVFGVVGMLAMSGLPRLRHPLFEIAAFEGASANRFFLCVRDEADPERTRAFLESLGPETLHEVFE